MLEGHVTEPAECAGQELFTGEVFGDGSMLGRVGPWASLGWAVATFKGERAEVLELATTSPM
eukprot:3584958-Lingulodinium_polyedra.AAC.1